MTEGMSEPRFTFSWNVVIRGKVVDTIHGATYSEALAHVRTHHGPGARVSAPGHLGRERNPRKQRVGS